MGACRFLLILMLAAVVDLGSPMLPQAGEAYEEFEEAAHGRRRPLRFVHVTSMPPVSATITIVMCEARRPALRRPPAPAIAPVRKVPPPLPDPASASDDH